MVSRSPVKIALFKCRPNDDALRIITSCDLKPNQNSSINTLLFSQAVKTAKNISGYVHIVHISKENER